MVKNPSICNYKTKCSFITKLSKLSSHTSIKAITTNTRKLHIIVVMHHSYPTLFLIKSFFPDFIDYLLANSVPYKSLFPSNCIYSVYIWPWPDRYFHNSVQFHNGGVKVSSNSFMAKDLEICPPQHAFLGGKD